MPAFRCMIAYTHAWIIYSTCCIYVYTLVWMAACWLAYLLFLCMSAYVHISMHLYLHVSYMNECLDACQPICMHACMFTCMPSYMNVRMMITLCNSCLWRPPTFKHKRLLACIEICAAPYLHANLPSCSHFCAAFLFTSGLFALYRSTGLDFVPYTTFLLRFSRKCESYYYTFRLNTFTVLPSRFASKRN